MPGFSGKHYNRVDDKGRVVIPKELRAVIEESYSTRFYITTAPFDPCLHLYPLEEWLRFEEKVRALPTISDAAAFIRRRVIASAQECGLDGHGRILIPAPHRVDAGIDGEGEVVIVGLIDKIEIWKRERWDEVVDPTKVDSKAFKAELASYGI